ncbi:MAG: type II secretion system F family protein [Acidimicrobiia bacterium]
MSLLAAVAIGVFCSLLAGLAFGIRPAMPKRLRTRPSRQSTSALWLQQAGANLTPAQFWTGSVAAGIAMFVVLTALTQTPVVAIVPALAVASLPRAFFARRRRARLDEVQQAWPDGLRDVLASVSAGRPISQALVSLAEHGPTPLQVAFARFPSLARMLGTVPALEIVKEELADPTSDRVIEVLILAHQRGGRIVRDIIEDLIAATTRDLKATDEVRTQGLEMRINARAVIVLPWSVLVVLALTSPQYRVFYRSSSGLAVVAVGAILSVVGGLLIARLGRSQTETRVFGATGDAS